MSYSIPSISGVPFNFTESSYVIPSFSDIDFEFEPIVSTSSGTCIQIGDSWKVVSTVQINIQDEWKTVSAGWINVGDSWKQWL